MDPIGLGMEDFDRFGRHRANYENGQPVDASGDVDGRSFTGARELNDLLAEDPRVMQCLVKQLYRYSAARLESAGDAPVLKELDQHFQSEGYQLKALLLALVGSDGFRFTSEAAE